MKIKVRLTSPDSDKFIPQISVTTIRLDPRLVHFYQCAKIATSIAEADTSEIQHSENYRVGVRLFHLEKWVVFDITYYPPDPLMVTLHQANNELWNKDIAVVLGMPAHFTRPSDYQYPISISNYCGISSRVGVFPLQSDWEIQKEVQRVHEYMANDLQRSGVPMMVANVD